MKEKENIKKQHDPFNDNNKIVQQIYCTLYLNNIILLHFEFHYLFFTEQVIASLSSSFVLS